MVALGGVVVDDVEDHFDPRRVQRLDHPLELGDLGAGRAGGHVALLGREERERAVPPVVAEVAIGEEAVVGGLVDGEELHRRDAERGQVLDDGGVREAGVGAAELGRELGVELGQPADVGLIDDGAAPRDVGRRVAAPVERVVDDHGFGRAGGAVALIDGEVGVVGSSRRYPNIGSRQSISPHSAFAYGSTSSLCGLQRCPRSGA